MADCMNIPLCLVCLLVICFTRGEVTCPDNCKTNDCHDGGVCYECADGYYGMRCYRPCPSNCIDSQCARYRVTCTKGCRTSWYGRKCLKRCKMCDGGCHIDSGKCKAARQPPEDPKGCNQSYTGVVCFQKCSQSRHDCDVTTECADCLNMTSGSNITCGFDPINSSQCLDGCMGVGCSELCRGQCVRCDRYTGECTVCQNGWYGPRCALQCPASCTGYGCDSQGTCREDWNPGVTGNNVNMMTVVHEDIGTMPPIRAEKADLNLILVLTCCLMALIILGARATIRWRIFSRQNTPLVSARDTDHDSRNKHRFMSDLRLDRHDSDREGEYEPSHGSYLNPVRDADIEMWLDNNHYRSVPSDPSRQVRQGQSHYELLNFVRHGDPNHVYEDLPSIHISQV